jgi:hypothetical protein
LPRPGHVDGMAFTVAVALQFLGKGAADKFRLRHPARLGRLADGVRKATGRAGADNFNKLSGVCGMIFLAHIKSVL